MIGIAQLAAIVEDILLYFDEKDFPTKKNFFEQDFLKKFFLVEKFFEKFFDTKKNFFVYPPPNNPMFW